MRRKHFFTPGFLHQNSRDLVIKFTGKEEALELGFIQSPSDAWPPTV